MTAYELAVQFGLYRSGNEWCGTCPVCDCVDASVPADETEGDEVP
jgi:hypothetical protein